MSSLPSLLRKLREVGEKISSLQAATASAIAEREVIEKQIIIDRREAKPRRYKKRRLIPDGLSDKTRGVIEAIHAAGVPLGRNEIGEKLGIKPPAAAKRLERAIELQFVERATYGKYRLTSAATKALKQ